MKGYWLGIYDKINNMEKLKEYAPKATAAITKYSGKFLARGGKNIILEGKNFPRTVIVEFQTFSNAKECYESKEYKEALSILEGHVERNLQIIEGV